MGKILLQGTPVQMMDFSHCLSAHGYLSDSSDSDISEKSFLEKYHQLKPPPYDFKHDHNSKSCVQTAKQNKGITTRIQSELSNSCVNLGLISPNHPAHNNKKSSSLPGSVINLASQNCSNNIDGANSSVTKTKKKKKKKKTTSKQNNPIELSSIQVNEINSESMQVENECEKYISKHSLNDNDIEDGKNYELGNGNITGTTILSKSQRKKLNKLKNAQTENPIVSATETNKNIIFDMTSNSYVPIETVSKKKSVIVPDSSKQTGTLNEIINVQTHVPKDNVAVVALTKKQRKEINKQNALAINQVVALNAVNKTPNIDNSTLTKKQQKELNKQIAALNLAKKQQKLMNTNIKPAQNVAGSSKTAQGKVINKQNAQLLNTIPSKQQPNDKNTINNAAIVDSNSKLTKNQRKEVNKQIALLNATTNKQPLPSFQLSNNEFNWINVQLDDINAKLDHLNVSEGTQSNENKSGKTNPKDKATQTEPLVRMYNAKSRTKKTAQRKKNKVTIEFDSFTMLHWNRLGLVLNELNQEQNGDFIVSVKCCK